MNQISQTGEPVEIIDNSVPESTHKSKSTIQIEKATTKRINQFTAAFGITKDELLNFFMDAFQQDMINKMKAKVAALEAKKI